MPMIKKSDDLSNWIKAIGQDLIDRADDIGRDTRRLASVTIYVNITPDEIVNFDVTKNYNIVFDDKKEV